MSTEYIIKSDGQVLRRDYNEIPLAITPQFLESCAAGHNRKYPELFEHPAHGLVGLTALSGGMAAITVTLKEIQLRTNYQSSRGNLVPLFSRDEGGDIMALVWKVPEDIKLRLLTCINPYPGYGYRTINAYLFAIDKKGAAWRLPLPNLFDDCRLCMGASSRSLIGSPIMLVVDKTITLINNSPWNADLLKDPTRTQSMFRFKAKDNGFDTMAPIGTWTDHCLKVATPWVEMLT